MNARDSYKKVIELRNEIRSTDNPTPKMWAALCRQCAITERKFFDENSGPITISGASFLDLLDMVWSPAKGQMERLQ